MAPLPEPVFSALLDDAAAVPPGDTPLHAATAAFATRTPAEGAGLVRSLVVRDTDLPLVRGFGGPLHVVVTGGAGQVAGPAGLCARLGLTLAGLEVALRDDDDLAGNARRVVAAVDAARAEGALDEAVPVHVELPAQEPTHGWLAAADEVAAAELLLTFRAGDAPDPLLAAWIDAALDRETPFRATTDGTTDRHLVGLLTATRLAFDGAARDEVVAALGSRGAAAPAPSDLAGVRRWVTSVGTPDVAASVAALRAAGPVT